MLARQVYVLVHPEASYSDLHHLGAWFLKINQRSPGLGGKCYHKEIRGDPRTEDIQRAHEMEREIEAKLNEEGIWTKTPKKTDKSTDEPQSWEANDAIKALANFLTPKWCKNSSKGYEVGRLAEARVNESTWTKKSK